MRKPVGKWSNEDVIEWVGGLGEWTQHNYSDIFRKEVRKQKEGQIVSLSYTPLSLLLFPPSSLPPYLPLLPLHSSCLFFSLTRSLLLSSPLPFCHLSPFFFPFFCPSPSLLPPVRHEQKITGPRLLLLNEKALETIGVHSEYRRQTILQAIQELKVQEYSTPRNFQEFKVGATVTVPDYVSLWYTLNY